MLVEDISNYLYNQFALILWNYHHTEPVAYIWFEHYWCVLVKETRGSFHTEGALTKTLDG